MPTKGLTQTILLYVKTEGQIFYFLETPGHIGNEEKNTVTRTTAPSSEIDNISITQDNTSVLTRYSYVIGYKI